MSEVLCKAALKGNRVCRAALICCSDERFWEAAAIDLLKTLHIETVNPFMVPGGVKVLNDEKNDRVNQFFWDQINFLNEKHPFEKIIICAHSNNCAAYAREGLAFESAREEEWFHTRELIQAGVKLGETFPGCEVIAVYSRQLDPETVEFVRVP